MSKSRGRLYFTYAVGAGAGGSVPVVGASTGAPGIAGGTSTPGSVVPVPAGSGVTGGVGVQGAAGGGATGSVAGGVATPVPSLFGPILKITAFLSSTSLCKTLKINNREKRGTVVGCVSSIGNLQEAVPGLGGVVWNLIVELDSVDI